MQNSPMMCQLYAALALAPLRKQYPQYLIYHYMDDILIAGENIDAANLLPALQQQLQEEGLQIAPEKVHQQAPWKYLGMLITEAQIWPQKLTICTEIRTLTDAQKLIGYIQWICNTCGITNEDLEPLMPLLKGGNQANLPRELTEKQQKALTQIATKLGNSFADPWSPTLPLSIAVPNKAKHMIATLMQWDCQA
ncbi:endogenous retrovirus group K member 18 Pol protein-like protein [Turdus rufiventris]|nr:endogenous retrovirus group K member 18 Pol protein-like protein [Turdus rufiventris]